MHRGHRAVFLDRDGVVNELVFNPRTGAYESPLRKEEFVPRPGVFPAMRLLKENGYLLFVVSNQPSWAKGKNTRQDLEAVDAVFQNLLRDEKIALDRCFYCYHHPRSVVQGLRKNCRCRKPGTLFPRRAQKEFGIVFQHSWFVGDRLTDVECGRRVGCGTILVRSQEAMDADAAKATFVAAGLPEAARIILENTN